MKKIIIALAILIVILISAGFFISASSFDTYKSQEKVNQADIFNSKQPTIYYYYQETCAHCHAIKPQINNFVEEVNKVEGLDFKLVDMGLPENKEAFGGTSYGTYGGDLYQKGLEQMNLTHKVQMQGTPGAAYVQDGLITAYGIGADVFSVLEEAAEQFDIKTNFNRDAV